MEIDVVVVGAGPVGLLLAGELRLGGATVVVLERLVAASTESRASTLHARTMELLDQRGLLARLGTPPTVGTGHFGGLPLDLSGVASPYPGQWKVPQTRTESLLREWAVGLGAQVRRGHAVHDLVEYPDHVEVRADGPGGPVRLRARYVVGCDGEDSTVRRLAGFDLTGHGATREMLRADVAGIDVPDRRFQRLDRGLAVAARRDDGVTRVMVHEYGRAPVRRVGAPAFAEVVGAWQRVTGENIGGGRPLWVNAFGDACRQATRYRKGRVLLAGDAAHVQMPVGGQALNLGLQDAANLGWKLAAEVRGWTAADLLDSYHTERHAVGARVLTSIAAQTLLLLGGPEIEPVRTVVGELLGYEDARRTLAEAVSGVDVRYPVAGGQSAPAGTRLTPQVLDTGSGPQHTALLLRAGVGLLLCRSGSGDRDAAWPTGTAQWRSRVRVVHLESKLDGDLADVDTVLVRPDGYVAWAGTDRAELIGALYRWFGTPE